MVCGKSFSLTRNDLTYHGAENFLFARMFSSQTYCDPSLTHSKRLPQSQLSLLVCGRTTGSPDPKKIGFHQKPTTVESGIHPLRQNDF